MNLFWRARYHSPHVDAHDGIVTYGLGLTPSFCFWLVPTWQPPTPEPEA
jgi:hypothetical protein